MQRCFIIIVANTDCSLFTYLFSGMFQIEYFGLRYVDRRLQFRWVDMDRPLKKQLDKHAESPLLYFGVMFYVNNVMSIHDPVAR